MLTKEHKLADGTVAVLRAFPYDLAGGALGDAEELRFDITLCDRPVCQYVNYGAARRDFGLVMECDSEENARKILTSVM